MNNNLRIGIVGSRFAADFHCKVYRHLAALGVEVAGCYSPTRKNRDAFAREWRY